MPRSPFTLLRVPLPPRAPLMSRTAMIQQQISWKPSSPLSWRPFWRFFWTCRLVVLKLTLSSLTCLLNCLHWRHLASGEAIAKPWIPSQSSSWLSEGRSFWRGGSVRLVRLRLQWLQQRMGWTTSFMKGLRRAAWKDYKPCSWCWKIRPRSLPCGMERRLRARLFSEKLAGALLCRIRRRRPSLVTELWLQNDAG
jgi:hypothetical protein